MQGEAERHSAHACRVNACRRQLPLSRTFHSRCRCRYDHRRGGRRLPFNITAGHGAVEPPAERFRQFSRSRVATRCRRPEGSSNHQTPKPGFFVRRSQKWRLSQQRFISACWSSQRRSKPRLGSPPSGLVGTGLLLGRRPPSFDAWCRARRCPAKMPDADSARFRDAARRADSAKTAAVTLIPATSAAVDDG